MRITMIISSISAGGAERVMSMMANYWVGRNYDISLITLDSKNSDFYSLDPAIKRYALDVMHESTSILRAAKNNLSRIKKLRSVIRQSTPEVIISFMDITNVLTLLSTRGTGLKVIVSERTVPHQSPIESEWSRLRKMTYPWADAVVVQSADVANWVGDSMKCKKVVVIPNPIYLENDRSHHVCLMDVIGTTTEAPTIIAMGRMSEEKGFDLLLKAFTIVASSYPNWRLVIFGEGQERHNLTLLSKDIGLSDKVFMPGLVKNPANLLRDADIFVMSSRFEGFPNALLEAMACGLPVISFDCPSGPGEIIRDGIDGLLVPAEDVDALANAMKRLMADEEERKRFGARAVEVLDRFGIEKVMKQWEELLQ